MKTMFRLLVAIMVIWPSAKGFSQACNANFGFSVNPNNNMNWYFWDSSYVTPNANQVSYYWSFGDGTSGTGTQATHTYTTAGTYTVCLFIVASFNGVQVCSDSACHVIVINNGGNPCAGLQANAGPDITVAWGSVGTLGGNPTATGGTAPYTYSWSPANNLSSTTIANPQVAASPNAMTYCVLVTDANGCTALDCAVVTPTNSSGCAGFTAMIGTGPNGGLVATATGGTQPYQYVWSNGATTSSINVNANGVYCVTVYDAAQCSASDCDTVTGLGGGGCDANFTYTINGNMVVFYNQSTPSGISSWWVFGDNTPNSQQYTQVPHYYLNGTYTACLYVIDSANNCSDQYCQTITIGGGNTCMDTLCGTVFNDANGNGLQDAGENGVPNMYVVANNTTAITDGNGNWSIVVPCTPMITVYAYCNSNTCQFTLPVGGANNGGVMGGASYTVSMPNGGTLCNLNFGIQYTTSIITGRVYIDANGNGQYDAGEQGISYQPVQVGSQTVYSGYNGIYNAYVAIGTYNITYTPNGLYSGIVPTPTGYTVNVTATGTTYGNNNFGLQLPAGINLAIDLVPHTTVTPGFPAWYHMQVCNIGSVASGGTVNLFYDPVLTYTSSTPAAASVNGATHTATWNINNLNPGQCTTIWVYFSASQSAVLGSSTFELATVTPANGQPDINTTNNVDTVHQTVVGSWDPNNKLPVETNYETNPNLAFVSAINGNQRIEYTINFQNLGSAPAVNVVVNDVLSADLDASTFEFMGSSHDCQLTQNGNELNYIFSAIMLPAESVDEPNSHGWIKFAVNANAGLPAGHIISDEASVYFDFNAPVVTNDAAVTMVGGSKVAEGDATIQVAVAPNPMGQFTTFSVKGLSEEVTLTVTDITGREVTSKTFSENTRLDRNGLAEGIYTYRILHGKTNVANGKLLIH